jgi:hypothetical protein
MKTLNAALSGVAMLLLAGAATTIAAPKGWFLAGSKPAEYESDVDAATTYGGAPSAFLRSKGAVPEGFGTLMQSFTATEYLGKRVRLSGFVKAENVTRWAGLWMRVDKGTKPMAFDNMQRRAIKGSTGWMHYEVVLDVAPDATGIAFGILMDGPGTVWINSVKVETVGTETPVTSTLPAAADKPVNLGFEQKQ